MERHHQAHAAAPPSLSLMRAGAIVHSSSSSTITNSTTADRRVSSVQLHGAGAAHDARERVIPMTPVLMASFPSQAPQSHGTESPYHTGQPAGAGSRYSLRRGLVRERQTPQWFTAAPLLSQFYNSQPSGSLLPPTTAATATATTLSAQSLSHHYQQQQQQDQDQDDQNHHHSQSETPLQTRGYEHYRFPNDVVSHRQQQQHQHQHFYSRRPSHFELRGDETSPLLAVISSAPAPPPRTGILSSPNDDHQHESHHEHTAPPAKKRKKTAFRLRNFLCMHPGCGKSFTDNAHLRDHTFVHTGEKSLSCETCGKCFARLSTLHDHQRVHSGERPYSCLHPGCEKRYSSRAALRFHVAGHASMTRQRSIGGGANGNTSSNTRSAAATHHPVGNEPLVLHLSGIHESRRSPMLEPGVQLPLQLHQHRHNGVASPPPPPAIANDTLYLHAKIQTQQTQIAELQAELQKLKRSAKKKKTQPSSTAASTSRPNRQSALAAPMVASVLFLVDGMKPFQCFVCYHKFANFFQLSFHAKQHPEADITDVVRAQEPLPVGPKFCPEADCEYAEKNQKPLKNLQTLKRHWQRRHQLSRPYVCAFCSPNDPKTFKTKENLKAHEKDCKGGGSAAAVSVRGSTRREHAVEAT